MDSLEKKEKNLQKLIEKLSVVTSSYSQPLINNEKIHEERNQLGLEKKELEKRNLELAREHQYLKNKLIKKLTSPPKTIGLDRISIVSIQDDIESWEVLYSYPLISKKSGNMNLGRPV